MGEARHGKQTIANGIHGIISYVYPDAATRVAAVGFDSGDLYKVALQTDDGSRWLLTSITPVITWDQLTFSNPLTNRGDIIFGGAIPPGAQTRLPGVNGAYLRSGGNTSDPTFVRNIDADSLIVNSVVGAVIDPSAVLEARSTTRGFLQPRMTNAQRLAISSPAEGLRVYGLDDGREYYWDGDNWRKIETSTARIVTVITDGTGDFTSIQDAINSITDASDTNRYVVKFSPGIYTENILMKDYVTVSGYGWDSLIDGYIEFFNNIFTILDNCRISSVNKPAISANITGEADLTGVYLQSVWNSSADTSLVRCTVEVQAGTVYLFKESECFLTVNDLVNITDTIHQAIYHVDGYSGLYLESFGSNHFLTTNNSQNTIDLILHNSYSTNSTVFIREGSTTFTLTSLGHQNAIHAIRMEGANGEDDWKNARLIITAPPSNNAVLHLVCVRDSVSDGDGHAFMCEAITKNISDSNVFLGSASTINDEVEITQCMFYMNSDTLPPRLTVYGVDGYFRYDVTNNRGSREFYGRLNDIKHYGTGITNPMPLYTTDPTPADGDRYYNTSLQEDMRFDGYRSKWLSTTDIACYGGRSGSTAAGSYYRGIDNLTFGTNRGIPVHKGTLIGLAWSKSSVASSTVEILLDEVLLGEVGPLVGAGLISNWNLNLDIDEGLLQFRNKLSGNTADDVQIKAVYKKRI